MAEKKEEISKRPYEKPLLRSIPLAAEEVLAVSCKSFDGAPGKNGKSQCGYSPCSVPGAFGS